MNDASRSALAYLRAALRVTEIAIQEMATDLFSARVPSLVDESELEGIYFNLSLYHNTVQAIANDACAWERRFSIMECHRDVDRNNLHGHVRAIIAMQYCLEKIAWLLAHRGLTLDERQMMWGVKFGVEASLNTLEAYLPPSAEHEPVRFGLVGA